MGHFHILIDIIVMTRALAHDNISDQSNSDGESETSGDEPPDGEDLLLLGTECTDGLWVDGVLSNTELNRHGWIIGNNTVLDGVGISDVTLVIVDDTNGGILEHS